MSLSLPLAPAPSHILVHPHDLSDMASPYIYSFTHHGLTTLASGFCSSNTQVGWLILLLFPLQSHGSSSRLCWTFVQTSPSQTGLLQPTCLSCIQPPLIPTPLVLHFPTIVSASHITPIYYYLIHCLSSFCKMNAPQNQGFFIFFISCRILASTRWLCTYWLVNNYLLNEWKKRYSLTGYLNPVNQQK